MSRGGTLIFLCVRLVSASLCFRPPMFPSACVSVSLPLCPPVPLPVCTLNTVAHRALFHRSLSTYPVLFVLLACPVLSFFPLSYLFIPLFLFFSFSLIFSLPILLTLLVPTATHLFLSKTLYREHTLRNIDVPLAATHPFELKTLCRKRERGGCRP